MIRSKVKDLLRTRKGPRSVAIGDSCDGVASHGDTIEIEYGNLRCHISPHRDCLDLQPVCLEDALSQMSINKRGAGSSDVIAWSGESSKNGVAYQ